MHYLRARRTGSPETTRKPGRPKELWTIMFEKMGMDRDHSPRTLARMRSAYKLGREAGLDLKELAAQGARPNGTINVSKLYRLAYAGWINWVFAEIDNMTPEERDTFYRLVNITRAELTGSPAAAQQEKRKE